MIPVGFAFPHKPRLGGQDTGGEVQLSVDQWFTIRQVQFEHRVGRSGEREVHFIALTGFRDHVFFSKDRNIGARWSHQAQPTAHDKKHDQSESLCMGTPTRHGHWWPSKDLKDTPPAFAEN